MNKIGPILCFCLLVAISLQPAKAQKRKQSKSTQTVSLDTTLFKGLKWRNIGPYRGGRSVAVAGVVQNPLTYYMGSTGGGMWKTEDAGISWNNISDGYFKTGTVGAIGICESDPNVIYTGMGEHAVRGVMTSHGDGVYKSTDAGSTWSHVGLENTRHISDVIVHPQDPEVVYVSAQGALYGSSTDRGIYKTTDGGTSWEKVLFVDTNTGASGLSMDMTNPRILYAATWQHRRYPWKVESGGPGSGIHKSTDGGTTWEKLSEGLPEAMGKIGISVSRANPQRVYAVIEADGEKGGIYRSDDGGKKWLQTSTDRVTIARAWYYMEIFADPVDEETVYVLNAPFLKSIDGGKTFTPIPVPHGDTHDHWINPNNNQVMINANDGGGCISFNGGGTWSSQQNQPTAQFYRVITDHQFPYYVYGGQQDNSSMAIASRTNFVGIGWKDWFAAAGGESAYLAFDPKNPETVYGSSIQGFITRYRVNTRDNKSIQVYPELALGMTPKDMKYRYNWNPPLVANPLKPSTMYFGAQKVLKTSDEGNSWEEISPDLTRNQIERQGKGGGPYTNEAAGGENYNTIMYIAPSTHEDGTMWVGTDDGLVHLTSDEGKTWQAVSPKGLPEMIINSIEISPHDPATAYLVGMRYKFDDHRPYIYKTDNYGQSWLPIVNGIGEEDFVRVVREDPKAKGILYAGTERGLYVSFNQGQMWNKLQLNLPMVPINDLVIQDNDLVAATAGRGFWILDDLGSFQQGKGVFPNDRPLLFQPKETVKFTSGGFASIRFPNMGQNPMNGVLIDYFLPEDMDSMDVRLEVLDQSNKLIKSYTNKKDDSFKPYPGGPPPPDQLPAKKGLNRYAWDFRSDRLPNVAGEFIMGDYRGHQVAPGTYQLKLVAEDDSVTTQVLIIPDPRLKATEVDFSDQQKMLAEIDQLIEEIHQSIIKMRKASEQMEQWNKHLQGKEDMDTLIHLGDTIISHISEWEQNLLETKHKTQQDVVNFESRLSAEFMFLKGYIDSHDPQITAGASERFEDLKREWGAQKLMLDRLINHDVASYNKLYREKEIPAVILD